MEKEYAIQIGGTIWNGDAEEIPRFPSEEAAEFKLKCIEELDAYRPKRPKVKRKIVVREVGPWQTLKQMKKHQKRPYIYLVQKLESIQPKAVCSYRTVMATTDAERCKRFVAKMIETGRAQYYVNDNFDAPRFGAHPAHKFSEDFDDTCNDMLNVYLVGVRIKCLRDGEPIACRA